MTIRGDLQGMIGSMVADDKSSNEILRAILEELTSGDFLSVLMQEEIDVSNYCSAVSVLKDRCLIK